MIEFYNILVARLQPLLGGSGNPIRNIDLFNNQLQALADGKQKNFRFDSIFIEFIVQEVRDVGYGIKDKIMIVRFYFALKSLRASKVQNLDFYDEFASLVQGFASQNNTHPAFSGLREVALENDEDHDNIALPYVDYETVYRDVSGYWYRRSPLSNPPYTPDVGIDIVNNI